MRNVSITKHHTRKYQMVQMQASSLPSDVLSSEVMFYHQSLSEISCRQLQLLGVWSPRYLECTFRRFIDLKVVEIILMSLV